MKLFRNFSKGNSRQTVNTLLDKRRLTKQEMIDQEKKQSDLQAYWNAPQTDIIIHLNLYMRHDCSICQQTFAILNYYGISFDKTENILFLDMLRSSKTVPLEKWDWPLMKVNISLDPVQFVTQQDIITYLVRKELILNPIHLTNSSWAAQGQEYIRDHIAKPLDVIFLNPMLTWQNLFKSNPDAYKKDAKNYLLISYMMKLAKRAIVQCSKNFYKLINDKEQYSKAEAELKEGLKGWGEQLQDHDYHGGNTPDEADFELFGLILSKLNSYSFRKYLENKTTSKFSGWLIRMQQICRYDPDRYYVNSEQNTI